MAASTSVESTLVLTLARDAECVCGEALTTGERVGFDVLSGRPLCLHCLAAGQVLGTAVVTAPATGTGTATGVEALAHPAALTDPVEAALRAARRDRCVQEVALWRASQAAREEAYRRGVLASAGAGLRTAVGNAVTRVLHPTRRVSGRPAV